MAGGGAQDGLLLIHALFGVWQGEELRTAYSSHMAYLVREELIYVPSHAPKSDEQKGNTLTM